jgi:hypothetical protein
MKTQINFIVFSIISILASCKNQNDGLTVAKEYCDCMKANGAQKNYAYGRVICDGELIQKSRMYKLDKVDLTYYELHFKVPENVRDSVRIFDKAFDKYVTEHCCEVEINCNKDTAGKNR